MKKFTVLFILSVFSFHLYPQSWESTFGPMANTPYDIKKIGNTWFLASDWGNYRSADNGQTWAKLSLPCPEYGGSITSFWPIDQKIYFRDYVSTDGGNNWNLTSNAESSITKYTKDSSFIFSLSDLYGPYFSADQGNTWNSWKKNLPNGRKTGMVIADHKLYVSVDNLGVYYTSYNDSLWHAVSDGLPAGYINALETDGTRLLAGLNSGLYTMSLPDTVWKPADTLAAHLNVTRIHLTGQKIYLGTYNGIYVSPASSFSWQMLANTSSDNVLALFEDGSDLMAGFYGKGLYRTSDLGQHWALLNKGINAGSRIDYLSVAGNSLWASSGYYHSTYQTTNGGSDWRPVTFNYQIWWPTGMLTALFTTGTEIYYGEKNGYIYYSHDGGTTWHVSDSSMYNNLDHYATAFIKFGADIYAIHTGRLLKSPDKGLSWLSVNTGISTVITSITVHNNELFIGTNNNSSNAGIYKSPDGNTWISCAPITNAYNVTQFASAGNNLYAALSSSDPIRVSADDGLTWNIVGTSSLPALNIGDMLTAGNELFVTPYGYGNYGTPLTYGIYRLSNGNWQAFNNGLQQLDINTLATDGAFLYAAVDYDGVYRISLNTLAINAPGIPDIFSVYPNPSHDIFTVQLAKKGSAQIRILDATGKMLYSTSMNEFTQQVDLSQQPAGIYFIEMIRGDERQMKKIILE